MILTTVNVKPLHVTLSALVCGTLFVLFWKKDSLYRSIDDYISSLSCLNSENTKVETLVRLSYAIEIVNQSVSKLEIKYHSSNDEETFKSQHKKEILELSEDINLILIKLDQINGSTALLKWRKKLINKLQEKTAKKIDQYLIGIQH